MMERTDHREDFFAIARTDPYTTALMHQYADAWVSGYEQATKAFVEQLKAAGEERAAMDTWDHFHSKSRAEWRDEALAHLTKETAKNEAKMLAAMAAMGPTMAMHGWPGKGAT